MTRRGLAMLTDAGCLYLIVFGFLIGVLVERVRFDRQRTTVLQRLVATRERLHTHFVDLERQTEFSRHTEDR